MIRQEQLSRLLALGSLTTRHDIQRRNRRTRRTKPVFSAGSAISALIVVALLLVTSALASAQVTTADLVGTIKDSSGAVVPGVTVALTNEATGVSRSATTGDGGTYIFTSLQPGRYRLTAELPGFRKVERTGVELQVNQRAQVDLDLEVGLVSETVLIEGTAPLLETQSSVLGNVIEEKQVQELPLNGRNFVQLATLSPGVSGAGSGMRGTIMSGTRPDDLRPGTELFVNGNRENSNNYLYDGIDNNTRLTLVIVMRPNVEAIKEFKVQTNLFSAEQGRNPGGQVNVVTKSGGNKIHGAIYEFLRNDRFDANNFFANRAGQEKPPFKQNQFGGAIGGPIVTNKTFFFADYDGFRQDAGARVRQHRADAEDAAGGLQRAAGGDLRPADDGRAPRRRHYAPALPRQRHSAESLGPGDGQADECVSDADLVGIGQQPGHDADAHAGLESVRRAHRSHAQRTEQLPRPLFLVEDDDRSTRTRSPPSQLPGLSKAVGLGNEDTFAGPSALLARARRVRLGARVFAAPGSRFARRLQPLQPRFHASRRRAWRSTRRTARRAQRQPAGCSRTASRFSARRAIRASVIAARCRFCGTRRRFNTSTNLTFAGDKHTIKAGLDVRRRHMGEFQTNRGNGRFNFSPNITNNPANNTGGHAMASFLLGAPSLIEQDYLLA